MSKSRTDTKPLVGVDSYNVIWRVAGNDNVFSNSPSSYDAAVLLAQEKLQDPQVTYVQFRKFIDYSPKEAKS